MIDNLSPAHLWSERESEDAAVDEEERVERHEEGLSDDGPHVPSGLGNLLPGHDAQPPLDPSKHRCQPSPWTPQLSGKQPSEAAQAVNSEEHSAPSKGKDGNRMMPACPQWEETADEKLIAVSCSARNVALP